jgi:hypothetical protein
MKHYDVALSFAGEDRVVAEKLAKGLSALGISVFYDDFETHTLWGKDLTVELPRIYTSARYCIMIISAAYLEKMWTILERQAILSKFLKLKGNEYLLPLRIDMTPIPGLSDLTGYISVKTDSDIDKAISCTRLVLERPLRSAQV